ncbi:C25 family cysteine peptidase [uncultured Arcticibacterium sp.]|uniref:putative type IX secretion system sortase PorU2 n=1 Tax=uncultured Arcticibacterium sp. TaxID=2173042 RepID=UPI0030FCD8D8
MYLRKLYLLLLFPILSSFGQSQFGNDWINYDQEYWKITVSADGVYELPVADLVSSGFDANVNLANVQLFYMGKEMAIQVVEAEGALSDKIIFYGERNKGDLDSLVYRPSDARMNVNQSLFSDESSYFLTVGSSNGKRMEVLDYAENPNANYYIKRALVSFEEQYSFNNSLGLLPILQQSYFESGEGWSGSIISADSSSSFTVPLSGFFQGTNFTPKLSFKLNGRSRTPHKILYALNGVIQSDTLIFDSFEEVSKDIEFSSGMLFDGNLNIEFHPISQGDFDWYSVTYLDFYYPRDIAYAESEQSFKSQKGFNYPLKSGVWDISDLWNVKTYESKEGMFSSQKNALNFYNSAPRNVKKIENVNFREIVANDYNYIIISPESLEEGSSAYAAYRASTVGGAYKTLVISPTELFNQFTYGLRSPVAITRMADLLLQGSSAPKFLFLLGRGVSFPDGLKANQALDLVPSFGYPGSDVLLTAGTGGESEDVAGMPTGRLNVTTNAQILTYLDKVKETEAAPRGQAWKKRFLHLSGGKDAFEISSLARTLDNIKQQAIDKFWAADVKSARKQSLEEVENIDISEELNEGVGMITFAGHGSANVIDLNIGYCSDLSRGFDNKGKYPLMFFNGCGVGNVFYRYDPLTTDWLLTPDKGAIAVFANSFWSYLLPTQLYLNRLYDKLFVDSKTIGLTLGEIQQAVNRDLDILKSNVFVKANMHQMILQGDPAIKMFAMEAPDFALSDDGFLINSEDASKNINESDSIFIKAVVSNYGRYDENTVFNTKLIVERGEESNSYDFPTQAIGRKDTLAFKIPNLSGITKISLSLNDASARLNELSFENNDYSLVFDNWQAAGTTSIYPEKIVADNVAPLILVKVNSKRLESGDYIAASSDLEVKLIDENSLANAQFELLTINLISSSGEKMPIAVNSVDFNNENELIANTLLDLQPGNYQIQITGQDLSGNQAATYTTSFVVAAKEAESTIVTYPNPVVNGNEAYVVYQLVSPESPKESMLSVYNSQGRLMHTKKVTPTVGKNTETLEVQSFSAGVYTVKLELVWPQKEETLNSRFVILR